MADSLCKKCLQGIMVVVFIKTNIQPRVQDNEYNYHLVEGIGHSSPGALQHHHIAHSAWFALSMRMQVIFFPSGSSTI